MAFHNLSASEQSIAVLNKKKMKTGRAFPEVQATSIRLLINWRAVLKDRGFFVSFFAQAT